MHESHGAQHIGLGFKRALESPLITPDKEHGQTFEGHLGHLGERLLTSKQTTYTFLFGLFYYKGMRNLNLQRFPHTNCHSTE